MTLSKIEDSDSVSADLESTVSVLMFSKTFNCQSAILCLPVTDRCDIEREINY